MTKSIIRPLFLVDLDDTLFQTPRKMKQEAKHIATTDKNGQAMSYMNATQLQFVEWLLACADVVPVTARSVEAYQRVHLPFKHGAICAHGAVILTHDNQVDNAWHQYMATTLAPYKERLLDVTNCLLKFSDKQQQSLRTWVVEEGGMAIYALAKHNDRHDEILAEAQYELLQSIDLTCFYCHRNGNNLAIIPKVLNKRYAVEEWLRREHLQHGTRPIIGLGDSVSDLGFLQLCDWWGTPQQGQLAQAIITKIQAEVGV